MSSFVKLKITERGFFGGVSITSSTKEKLLGVLIDSDLNFEEHISFVCNKVSKKINALGRIANIMSYEKRRLIMKTFIESEFNYCPLVWMLHSRGLNNKINRLHERALRIAYSDYKSSFLELLDRDNSVTINPSQKYPNACY